MFTYRLSKHAGILLVNKTLSGHTACQEKKSGHTAFWSKHLCVNRRNNVCQETQTHYTASCVCTWLLNIYVPPGHVVIHPFTTSLNVIGIKSFLLPHRQRSEVFAHRALHWPMGVSGTASQCLVTSEKKVSCSLHRHSSELSWQSTNMLVQHQVQVRARLTNHASAAVLHSSIV